MQILFRKELATEDELSICQQHIPTVQSRTACRKHEVIIGRYSVLPFYRELEADLNLLNSRLINSPDEHDYVANVLTWSQHELAGLTPKTYDHWYHLPEGAYVLKGQTNSRKHQWDTHMFASTVTDVPRVARNLLNDSLISAQGIVVREYIPLKQLTTGLNGLPITNEHRLFYLVVDGKPELIASGFYWSSHIEFAADAHLSAEGLALANHAAELIKDQCTFFVIDVAETASGNWIVIEVNDGQMSGLNSIDPTAFYVSLSRFIYRI